MCGDETVVDSCVLDSHCKGHYNRRHILIEIIICVISLLLISRLRRYLFMKYGSVNVVVRLQRQGVAKGQEKRADHRVPRYLARPAANDSVWPLLQLQSKESAINTGESTDAIFIHEHQNLVPERWSTYKVPGRLDNNSTFNATSNAGLVE